MEEAAPESAPASKSTPPKGEAVDEGKQDNANNKGTGKKRKRENVDHLAKAYENVHFLGVQPDPQEIGIPGVANSIRTSTPGSPLRQFAHSFRASMTKSKISQVVHQHANGLCVVTAGSSEGLPPLEDVLRIEFVTQVAGHCSAKEKRKRHSKLLKKGSLNNNDKNNSDGVCDTHHRKLPESMSKMATIFLSTHMSGEPF